MKTSKLILTLSAIIAVVSLVLLVTTLDTYGVLTGRATDTGTANVTIESSSSILFTDYECDFGSGAVDEDPAYAVINSENSVTNGTWTPITDCLTLSNEGNANINVSLSSDVAVDTFVGGNTTNRDMEWKASCSSGTAELAAYASVVASTPTDICLNLAADGTSDIDIQLSIPEDAPPGTNDAVITATGILSA